MYETVGTNYPNAFARMQIDLARYRTGEAPEVGDRVHGHGQIVCLSDESILTPLPTGESVIEEVDGREVRVKRVPWYAARFDLISRAVPDTVETPASVISETASGVGSSDAPGGAVITGPGKYLTEFAELVTIVGPAGDRWVGFHENRHGHKTPLLLKSDGTKDTTFIAVAGDITGPYVDPPPPERFEGEHTLRDFIVRLNANSISVLHVWPRTQLADAIVAAFDRATAP